MFGTSGIRGPFGETVTAELALDIGRALTTAGYNTIVVGRDPRTTGPLLVDALSAGIREGGGNVINVGVASTPTVARSVGWRAADAGVSVTASHNPPEDNGIKLWSPSGMAFDEAQRSEIETLLASDRFESAAWDAVGSEERWEAATEQHITAIADTVPQVEDVHAVVDVGNGAGDLTIDALRALGCTVDTLNARPDGHFPSRPSEPTAEACTALQAHVEATAADIGIAHDGDGDRMMAVDETGRFVGGDELLALFGRAVATEGDRIAAPLNTSQLVDAALAEVGAELVRTRVGDVYVAERAREADVVFGGEPSGAWIWPTTTLAPDGPLAAARAVELVATNGPLSEQVASLEQYPLRRESIPVDDKRAVMDGVTEAATDRYDTVQQLDGVRIERDDGWMLIRASGTQPLVRLTAEGTTDADAASLLATARDIVASARPA
ncbi:phosphohexomutase (phosphoglucomutase / phosphomannomutase) [Natronomonas pharaonis DSM 2160]|uniref:Phosphohexomutase (Phosphoglucomutase / phosphomannomutase) n=1 Tax=Natronomonas pharaonis (strain ATCC 35678 / DSM 2160 / CIP 103997 / JCM 8858 / NBRC 14720 / NCIMB 2260 / Gabara) TaxID=348780 RepID=A0A1U7EYV7_NATPD|nr:phosphoglucosamine mutase [Natronomonas pharaonis]CAI50421.1 phosphohexomutase (phosphoglucomutase / phosphomannomutase) [Natronomonas pharaonis DSM 2160]